MNKEEFYKKNDDKFLALGFEKDETDLFFAYFLHLIPADVREEYDLEDDDAAKLLIGDTGLNKGFCIYTGSHFIWLTCGTPEEAIELTKQITAFEEC